MTLVDFKFNALTLKIVGLCAKKRVEKYKSSPIYNIRLCLLTGPVLAFNDIEFCQKLFGVVKYVSRNECFSKTIQSYIHYLVLYPLNQSSVKQGSPSAPRNVRLRFNLRVSESGFPFTQEIRATSTKISISDLSILFSNLIFQIIYKSKKSQLQYIFQSLYFKFYKVIDQCIIYHSFNR